MRRFIESEVAAVIDRGEALIGTLGIMDAVIATAAGHKRRDHHFRSDRERLAHEILFEPAAQFHDDAAELMTERERPWQLLGPMTFEDVQIGSADAAGADLNERGVLGDLR